MDERIKREAGLQDHFKLFAQLQGQLVSIEGDVAKRLKDQRQDQLTIYSSGEEDRHRIERLKVERAESDSMYIKNLVTQMERRLEEDQHQRLRGEEDNRKALEAKFQSLNEKIRAEEKMILERERRLMQQFQEGLGTMNEIIRGTKEQNLISLTHQQTILGDQIKSLY